MTEQRAGEHPQASGLLHKARAVVERIGALKRDFDGAHRLAHEAEVREALTRSELSLAVQESMIQRAELEARLRGQAVAAHAARYPSTTRRHNRLNQLADRILARLGPVGHAILIRRSGLVSLPRSGSGLFDADWYLAANPDVVTRRLSPLVHYLTTGGREGRSPGPLFDDAYYRTEHAEGLAQTSLTPLEHYLRVGAAGATSPHPLFDPPHYLAQSPELARGEDPLSHYLREGGRLGLSPHPLFNVDWYVRQAPESADQPALLHYLAFGWRRGLSPHPLFDAAWYLEQWPDVAEAGIPPLLHFVARGGFEGRSPSPWFDLSYYVAARGADLPAGVNPVVDYLRGGAWKVSQAQPGAPTAAYIVARPEVIRAGLTPLEHWARRAIR
ncbi:MAG: hypothetical protein ACK56C_16280 [Alphaproteobacteria bacterium]